jgi:hypothetical protein
MSEKQELRKEPANIAVNTASFESFLVSRNSVLRSLNGPTIS